MRLQGKTAPITGGSSGMELAAAPLFAAEGVARYGRLFFLEMSGDRIHSMNPDGSDRKTIVTGCHLPDGIVVDAEADHIYWTNMGVPNLDDGNKRHLTIVNVRKPQSSSAHRMTGVGRWLPVTLRGTGDKLPSTPRCPWWQSSSLLRLPR